MYGISVVSFGSAIAALVMAATPFQRQLESAPKPRPHPADTSASALLEREFREKCASGKEPPASMELGPGQTNARQDPSHPFTRPEYPPGARVRGEEGTAVMLMLVNERGRVVRARIERSTGSKDLDEAALGATREWRIIPAAENGEPICHWSRFAMTFHLEGGPPDLTAVKLLPSAERAFELMSGTQVLQWVISVSGKPAARGGVADLADEVMHARTQDFAQLKHDGEAILSLAFSEDDLQEVIRILESPVGVRLVHLEPILMNQVYFTVNPTVARTGCSVMLLDHSLDTGVAVKGTGGSGLPPPFREAIPRLVTESEAFCGCATMQPEWPARMRTGEDPLPAVKHACGKPPDLTW